MDADGLDPTLVAEMVAARMADFGPAWTAVGNEAIGPNTLAVRALDRHDAGPNHIDLGFVLDRERDDAPVIWDCAAGLGDSPFEIVNQAVETWAVCTAPVVIELLTRDGDYATHFMGDDPLGIPGWHCIHGPILGFGLGDGPEAMQQWALDHPFLRPLAGVLTEGFDRPELNGIKLLFGGDVAEVRINGEWNGPASDVLRALGWPRLDPVGFARCFVLAVHPVDDHDHDHDHDHHAASGSARYSVR